ncbi:hypothetical protein DXT99_20570 [Pontibacter diazotrophicus]|uniref:Uncharacterized protein n=1 Tax=Pontibacter diazotrophicus TaxID=1400979 RepID=A0A3D8L8G2_9BACT|nr:hypothetical protein [Pontibacter diazotrophicus]RDV13272.1 hypothetical protein DXT99_20570 [Pontibacter diazotrophicus]
MRNAAIVFFAAAWLLLLSACAAVQAQSPYTQQAKYRCWVYFEGSAPVYKGVLLSTGDSAIQVLPNARSYTFPLTAAQTPISIPATAIKEIRFRSKGRPGRGALFGGLIGIATGAIIGFADGDDEGTFLAFSAEEKAFMGSTLLLLPGVGIGALAGSGKEKIYVHGNLEVYQRARRSLQQYALQPGPPD